MTSLFGKACGPAASALGTAGRDIAVGIMILGRGTVGLTGLLTMTAVLALVGSETVRERVGATAVAIVGLTPPASSEATDKPGSDREATGTRWSGWLSAGPGGAAEPAQEHVTRYLSRRYRVAENAVRQIVGEAFRTGRALGVEPMLILAVTAIESGLNPFAQSPVGAQGLMQIMTSVHSEKFAPHGGDHAALDPIANLRVGSAVLRDLIRRGGSVERGLQLYVGAGNAPDDGGYSARVLGEMGRIKLAAAGSVREALSAGLRADNGEASGLRTSVVMPARTLESPTAAEGAMRAI
jgi:hypothetical protein